MSSALSTVPARQRRVSAYGASGLAALFVVIAVLPWVIGTPDAVIRLFAVIAAVAAVLLVLVAWSMVRSLRQDDAEQRFDAMLSAAAGGCTGCGHDHDLDEMTVQSASCATPDAADCAHDCASCVLSARH